MFYVYVLLSLTTNKKYVGFTKKDVKVRLSEHNKSSNIWSKKNKPFKLIYYESYYCKPDALSREKFLKSGIGNRIIKAIINEFSDLNFGV